MSMLRSPGLVRLLHSIVLLFRGATKLSILPKVWVQIWIVQVKCSGLISYWHIMASPGGSREIATLFI